MSSWRQFRIQEFRHFRSFGAMAPFSLSLPTPRFGSVDPLVNGFGHTRTGGGARPASKEGGDGNNPLSRPAMCVSSPGVSAASKVTTHEGDKR